MKLTLLYALILSIFLTVSCQFSRAFAQEGGGADTGGGDECEQRIKLIRDDIRKWILDGGAQNLTLPSFLETSVYNKSMLTQLENQKIKIECLKSGDARLPLKVFGVTKDCLFNQLADGTSEILCDYRSFMNPTFFSPASQYRLIHHEYAGLAGIEVPNKSDSNYWISNDISDFLHEEVVVKLAVKSKSDFEQFPRPYPYIYIGTLIDSAGKTEKVEMILKSYPGSSVLSGELNLGSYRSYKIHVDSKSNSTTFGWNPSYANQDEPEPSEGMVGTITFSGLTANGEFYVLKDYQKVNSAQIKLVLKKVVIVSP